jgi:hypothetical protein
LVLQDFWGLGIGLTTETCKALSVSKPQENPQIHRSIPGWLKGKKMDYETGTWNV